MEVGCLGIFIMFFMYNVPISTLVNLLFVFRPLIVENLRSGLWGNMAGLVVNIEPFVIDGFVNGGLFRTYGALSRL